MTAIPDLRLRELVEQVADEPVAPGGGAVSGAAAALTAALVVSAARASLDGWEDAAGVVAQAQRLRRRAEELPEQSRHAFADAVALLRSGTGEGEKDRRLSAALATAADVPLRTARIAAGIATLAAEVAEHGRDDVRPDVVAACVLAEACCVAAAHLVEVNLSVLPGDARVEAATRAAAEAGAARERVL